MSKTIKIPGRLESAETGNVVAGANAILDDAKGKKQNVINQETDAELLRLDHDKQGNLTFDQTPTEDSTNPVTSGGVYAADQLLSQAIEAILLLIPSAASALNKLVDMNTMNSSISTATASFKGTYNLVSDLHLTVSATHAQIAAALDALSLGADNNDYSYVQVPNTDTVPTEIAKTERYKFNGTNWAYEYDLNNSGFTSVQWSAINSGITTLLVSKLLALPTNETLVAALAAKQDNLTFDNVPTAGSNNPVKSGGIYTRNNEIVALINALDTAKQNVLTFDITPINGSTNPVTSNGVYIAISAVQTAIVALDAAKQNVLTFDSTPTLGSQNPVTSSGIKTELNRIDGNITILNDLYEALTQSALVVVQPTDTWPVANPEEQTIYRVVDRANTPPQYYSDYMWNGTTMVLMATYDNAIDPRPKKASQNLVTSGGVFDNIGALDVSELNATENPHTLAQYVDLPAALAAIPTDYQKGGMSIKFVQSSDKYVQYRLMADEWSTDTDDWAIADEGVYIENPEFLYVLVDKDNKILWGINTDGNVYYGVGVPKQVIDYVENKLAGFSPDEYEDIVAFLNDYLGSDTTLKAMIDSINERIPELIENPEFFAVTEDVNGRVLNGMRKDGVKVEYCDVIYPNGIPRQIDQDLPKSIKESNPLSFGSNYRGNSQTLNEPSYLITLSNVYNDKKGWLKTVRFYTNTAGTKTLHIGYIDQRSTAIIRLSFNCNAIVGFNEVDISEKHIIIEENETLFITANSISFDALGSTDNYPQMLSGQSNGVLEKYNSEYGASLYFKWDVVEVSSLYSFKADTDTIEENVGSLSSSVNALEKNINKVYDNNGNAYKLKIVNGELTPILQQFGNVLVIGNSVTRHPYNDSPGTRWLASNRGMASTIIDNDYCHLLREGLRVKVPQAQVTTYDGYQWERNLPTDKNTIRAYLEDYSGPYDLVVFALSENIASTDSNLIYNSCKAFFEVILEKWPDTTVLVTSTRMCIGESPNSPYGYKDIAIQKAARAMKFDYVDVRQRDYDAFVTNFNTGAWIPIYMNGDNGKFVAQKIFHTHPCDIGMLRIANDILVAIDCQPLENKIFQIATSCSQDYYAPTYWVDGGLVTVICYEEIPQVVTVTDSDGNNIPFEIKDMTIEVIDVTPSKSPIAGIVFTMPSSNVIISIN